MSEISDGFTPQISKNRPSDIKN